MMKIRKLTKKYFEEVMWIAGRLHPKWFDNFSINTSIPLDLQFHKGFVAEENNKILGFLTYASMPGEGYVKISWIGVDPRYHGLGVGTGLIKHLEGELKKLGVEELRVGTLAESTKYKPYEKTRTFYKKLGFVLEKIEKEKSKDTGKVFNMATLVKKL